MTFIFWQNIISIHQSPFLNELSNYANVILVVQEELTKKRKKLGWNLPSLKVKEVIISPGFSKIKHIFNQNPDAWHLISGLHAYSLPTIALKYAESLQIKNILILTEAPNYQGIRGALNKLKYSFFSYRYKNKIKGVLVTGNIAKKSFSKLYFDKEIIFDWGYFTEITEKLEYIKSDNLKPNLLFVGSLDKRKNILGIIEPIIKNIEKINKFTIVGDGPMKSSLEIMISKQSKIESLGTIPNNRIKFIMKNFDLLILPSLFEGWGAVINEALGNGMRVLCSDVCGASVLLDNNFRGGVFSLKKNSFDEKLSKWLAKGLIEKKDRQKIFQWANKSISPRVATNYFIEIIDYIDGKSKKKPNAPWLK